MSAHGFYAGQLLTLDTGCHANVCTPWGGVLGTAFRGDVLLYLNDHFYTIQDNFKGALVRELKPSHSVRVLSAFGVGIVSAKHLVQLL